MEQIDLQQFVSAGYFLIRAGNPDWEQLKTELLPETLLSLSDCIALQFDVSWGWSTGSKEAALQFGVRASQWDEFAMWCASEYSSAMDIWGMFYSPDAARRTAQHFLTDATNLHIIGVGLPKVLEETNWREPVGNREIYGIEKRIDQRISVAEGGQPIGFEVVSFGYGNFGHSWLCSYLHFEMYKLFGIRPGLYGLMQTEQDARLVYDWIAEDDMKGHRAEPEPYDYWLLVEYPLSFTNTDGVSV